MKVNGRGERSVFILSQVLACLSPPLLLCCPYLPLLYPPVIFFPPLLNSSLFLSIITFYLFIFFPFPSFSLFSVIQGHHSTWGGRTIIRSKGHFVSLHSFMLTLCDFSPFPVLFCPNLLDALDFHSANFLLKQERREQRLLNSPDRNVAF